MTWVEKMTVAAQLGLAADEVFETALVDGVEAGKRLVEDDEARAVDDGAEKLHGLRHALRQRSDRFLRPFVEVVLCEQRIGASAALDSGSPRNAPMKAIASRACIEG